MAAFGIQDLSFIYWDCLWGVNNNIHCNTFSKVSAVGFNYFHLGLLSYTRTIVSQVNEAG